MCGIIGYIGKEEALPVLLKGLTCMEYRGYDSAGLSVGDEQHAFQTVRAVGRVVQLTKRAAEVSLRGHVGIGHTRWATHGGITENNTHPHTSCDGKFILVHNGVIENYAALKEHLKKNGCTFYGDTDTEVLVNLIAWHYRQFSDISTLSKRFKASVRKALSELQGTYGIAVICTDCPNELIGARKSSPLVLGVGKEELFLASDIGAFGGRTKDVVFLSDGEIVHLQGNEFHITGADERALSPTVETVDWDTDVSDLGSYTSYMQKEIFEQPKSLENTMLGRFSADGSSAHLGGLQLSADELRRAERLLLIGCGSAYHACKVGEYLLERYARIPMEVEYASEFRYRNAPLSKNTLIFVVSQSGETRDTLDALHEARRKGLRVSAITNAVGSTVARESDGGVYQRSGSEIGVASTKAFTGQIATFLLLSLYLGRMREMSFSEGCRLVQALKDLPTCVKEVLASCDDWARTTAKKYAKCQSFYFIGRQMLFPIALEGALKLKEVSYIHAEAYPGGELKHGPIALIEPSFPTFVLASDPDMLSKNINNMTEIKARKGQVIALGIEGCPFPKDLCDDVFYLPKVHEAILPIITVLPLQLFAYYAALERGCDVDKPRNLAKAVTVE